LILFADLHECPFTPQRGHSETRFEGLISGRYAPQPDGQAVANESSNSLHLHTVPSGKNLMTAGAGRDPN
jgi:hypothetical protein